MLLFLNSNGNIESQNTCFKRDTSSAPCTVEQLRNLENKYKTSKLFTAKFADDWDKTICNKLCSGNITGQNDDRKAVSCENCKNTEDVICKRICEEIGNQNKPSSSDLFNSVYSDDWPKSMCTTVCGGEITQRRGIKICSSCSISNGNDCPFDSIETICFDICDNIKTQKCLNKN